MLADVFHWRQIRCAYRRIMRVHLDVGKKAMIVTLLLAVENGARRLCQKHFEQGRYRTTAPAVERVCGDKGSRSGSATTCHTLLFRRTDRAACRCSKCIGKRLPRRAQWRTWRDCIIAFVWEGQRCALADAERLSNKCIEATTIHSGNPVRAAAVF